MPSVSTQSPATLRSSDGASKVGINLRGKTNVNEFLSDLVEVKYFLNIAALKASNAAVGDTVITKGYYTDGDLGGSTYVILPAGAIVADGFGDHVLANGNIARLQRINGEYVNTQWGCRPGFELDDTAALNAMFSAPADNADAVFRFVGGDQSIYGGAEHTINNLGSVTIIGVNSRFKVLDDNATGVVLDISDCDRVRYGGLDVDINGANYAGIIDIHDIRFDAKAAQFSIYNFNPRADQFGMRFGNINKNPASIANNTLSGVQISDASFYNEATVLDTAFDYDNAWQGGRGLVMGDNAEYWRCVNSSFFGLCIGFEITDAGNGVVGNCEFQECLGVADRAYIASGIPEGGALYLTASGGNNGKLNVSNCKFNHNWGFSVRAVHNAADKPVHVSSCQFIANSFIAINITNMQRCSVRDCFFERAHNYLSRPSFPWGGFAGGVLSAIYLGSGAIRTSIENNDFRNIAGYAINADFGGGEFTKQKFANNTWSSDVTSGFHSFTPTVFRNNDLWT